MSQTYEQLVSGTTPFSQLYGKINNMSEALRSAFSGTAFPTSPSPVAGQVCFRTDRGKWYIYSGDVGLGENGWVEIAIQSAGLGAEIINARGTKSSLDQRLDVALNEDGTLKASTTLNPSQWYKPSLTFTYVSTTSFTVNGDQTDIYKSTRRLKINLTGSTVYSEVVSVSYSSPSTTVTIANAVLDNTLVDVEHSLFLPLPDNGALSKRMLDKVVTLTDGATINTDASAGNIFKVTLAGNRTLAAPTNPVAGQYTWVFTQDGTGNRTITLDSIFRNRTGLSSITLSTAANAVDYMTCIYNLADNKWDVVSFTFDVSDSFVNKTANYTIVAADLTGRKKFTNSGAGATLVNFRAPTAAANYRTAIRVVDGVDNSGAGLRFIPEVTDTVFMGGVTLSPYNTGTVAVTNGSAIVTGTDTSWTSNVKAGDSFRVTGDSGDFYIIQSVDSDTQITLSSNYIVTTGSGKSYGIGKSVASAVVGFEMIIECYDSTKGWTIRGVGVQPTIRVYMSTNQTITNLGVDTLVVFDTKHKDNNNNFVNTSGNYKGTPTIPGGYDIKVFAACNAAAGASDYIKAFINGNVYKESRITYGASGGNGIGFASYCLEYDCNGKDYIQIYANFDTTAQNVNVTGNSMETFFSISRRAD